MNKRAIALAGVCIVIAMMFPLVIYVYFENRFSEFDTTVDSYKLQLSDLLQENERLRQENENLTQELNSSYFKKAYIVTKLGWYLHTSSDVVAASKNSFTIYGTVFNVGATNATNCKLIVDFYNNTLLLQSSEVNVGTIECWSYTSIRTDIRCPIADFVTRMEVTPKWS